METKIRINERWKSIKGYEGIYEVSDCGNLRNEKTGKVLLKKNSKGYLAIDLYKNGERKSLKVHRLVAQAFIKNPDNLPQVNHVDGKKMNNYRSNLEWNSPKQNVRHSLLTGSFPIGERNGGSVLKETEVKQIRSLSREGADHKDLSKIFKVSRKTIFSVVHHLTWKHI